MPLKKTYSLRRRLLLSTSMLLLVFLSVMGVVLSKAFHDSVMLNAENALRGHILLLMSNIEIEDGKLTRLDNLPEARFSQLDSGLFAQITSSGGDVLWQSHSLLEERLPPLDTQLGQFTFTKKATWVDHPTLVNMTLGVEWETEQGELPFNLQVAEHHALYAKQLVYYQRQLAVWLLALGALLLLMLWLLMQWVMQPLSKVMQQVAQIEEGGRSRFDEDYPNEVAKLTQSLNQLVTHEEKQIQRHQQVLGNLAHSLKTPLAVLKGLSFNDKDQQEANKQLNAMHNIIEYQLQNASAVGRRHFVKPISIEQASQQIINSLSKLYRDKAVQVTLNIAANVRFYGDQGDWMELLGNLLENAFKWGQSQVLVSVNNINHDRAENYNRQAIQLQVDDDGVGIDPQVKQQILQRGMRLDSQTPGHGLGLHIVKSIVEAYDGTLAIESLKPQGTRFAIVLN